MLICRGVTYFASVTCLLHAFKECCPGGHFGSSWGGVLQFLLPCLRSSLGPWPVKLLEYGPAQAEVGMMLPLGELSLDMVSSVFWNLDCEVEGMLTGWQVKREVSSPR